MPIGGFASVHFYRITPASVSINGTSYSIATAPATGAIATGSVDLGAFLIEKAALNLKGNLLRRSDAIGTPADKSLLRDDPTLTLTIQAGSIGTPTLVPGDCIEIQIGMKATSTSGTPAAIPLSRWFITADGVNYDAGDPTKFQVTMELDRQNSAATLVEF